MAKQKRKKRRKKQGPGGTAKEPYKGRNQKLMTIGLALGVSFVLMILWASFSATQ